MKNQEKRRATKYIVIFWVFFTLGILKIPYVSAEDDAIINILYFNSQQSVAGDSVAEDDPILTAMSLDDSFNITNDDLIIQEADSGLDLLLEFDIITLVDPILESGDIDKIMEFVDNGGGLIYICGPEQSNRQVQLVDFEIIQPSGMSKISNNTEKAIPNVNKTDTNIFDSIDWNSAPNMQNYTILPASPLDLGSDYIIDISKEPIDDSISQVTDPLIMHRSQSSGIFIVFTAWLGEDSLESQHLWPYFNYLVYSSVIYSIQSQPLAYADWKYSPVPHLFARVFWTSMVSVLLIVTIYIYKRKRNQSKSRIDESFLSKIAEEKPEDEKTETQSTDEHKKVGTEILDEQPRLMKEEEVDEWEEIGYHRQLSGFLFTLFMSFILLGPQVLLTLYIYPNFILPYPQAAGYYSFVTRFFEAFWLFLDFGTSTAAAKFFAQYRVKQPRKAIRYMQIYIYWQLLSGVGQFAAVSMIGLYVFPYTKYAHMSWFFILHSMIQYPGFLAVFMFFFQGVQRLDLAQFLEIIKYVLFNLLFQYIMVIIFRLIFNLFPMYGQVFGAVVGLAIGSWISEFVFFALGFHLFKKQGYEGKNLFRLDFGKDEIKETFKYGIRLVVGNVWVPLVWFLQVILLSIHISDYSSEMAFFDLAYMLSQTMSLVGIYLGGMMPPISESLGNGKKKLFELGIVEMLRIMNWICYSFGAILLIIGDRIIIGFSGPTWERATIYFSGLLIHALMGPYSWAGDRIFQGTGRTDLNLYTWIIEQSIRAVGYLVLIPTIGMEGVIIAYNLGLAVKDILVWILIRRIFWKGKFYTWKTFIAPLLSAVCLYFSIESIARVIWNGNLLTTIIVVVISIFGGIYLSTFYNGFFGLWDDNTLKDFKKAADMVNGIGFMARGLYKTAEFAAKKTKSPFFGIHEIDIYEDAMKEAVELTHEKRVLVT
ncbi:MAG: oligosaccharide flippase family protein [Candidatus Lokiarchaeota archaeon]|nr:oligosaccharide flippase family protein [Candidatus Lokiarchaeota archaeon]